MLANVSTWADAGQFWEVISDHDMSNVNLLKAGSENFECAGGEVPNHDIASHWQM